MFLLSIKKIPYGRGFFYYMAFNALESRLFFLAAVFFLITFLLAALSSVFCAKRKNFFASSFLASVTACSNDLIALR